MKRFCSMHLIAALFATLFLAGCVHQDDTVMNWPAGPNRFKTPANKFNKSKMSVVGYELVQVRGPKPESAESRRDRLVKSGKIPFAPRVDKENPKGEITPPRTVTHNPARWRRWGYEQPAVMQEKSHHYPCIPDEVNF